MGMPNKTEKLVIIRQLPKASNSPENKSRQRHGSAPTLQPRPPSGGRSPMNGTTKMIDRKHSAPELLPPIGIKPARSPSYSPGLAVPSLDSPLEIQTDHYGKRTRRSPLSPTSTTSSHGGSSRSITRISPAAGGGGGLGRSKTWTGDLSSSQHGSGNKLETLYEMGHSKLEPAMKELSIINEAKPDIKESKLVASTSVTSPPPIDRHLNLKSTQTITLISSHPMTDKNNNESTTLPATPSSKPRLTANRLSEENLKKLRRKSLPSSKVPSGAKSNSDTGYDTDDEKEQRINDWIIGVEASQTEQPPDVKIVTEEPRDNAIHIVYDGD